MPAMPGKTLYDKIWNAHLVAEDPNGESILYIDLHLIHEVTTPQAFSGLRTHHRPVRRPDLTLAVADHNIPTEGQALGVDAVADPEARPETPPKPAAFAGPADSRWMRGLVVEPAAALWTVPMRREVSPHPPVTSSRLRPIPDRNSSHSKSVKESVWARHPDRQTAIR